MPQAYSEAPDVAEAVKNLCQENFKFLIPEGVTCRYTDAKDFGLSAISLEVVKPKLRDIYNLPCSYLLIVSKAQWDNWGERDRKAFLDNALCACYIDDKGVPKLGKPPGIWPQALNRNGLLWSYEAMEYRGAVAAAQLRFPEDEESVTQPIGAAANAAAVAKPMTDLVGKGGIDSITISTPHNGKSVTLNAGTRKKIDRLLASDKAAHGTA